MTEANTQPTNAERSARIPAVLAAYDQAAGDPSECLVNLLTDLQHFAAAHGLDFEDALHIARHHFEAESEGPSPLPVNLAGRLDLTKHTVLA
jgi:hypothetical protein